MLFALRVVSFHSIDTTKSKVIDDLAFSSNAGENLTEALFVVLLTKASLDSTELFLSTNFTSLVSIVARPNLVISTEETVVS
jgi:hypothetical protein